MLLWYFTFCGDLFPVFKMLTCFFFLYFYFQTIFANTSYSLLRLHSGVLVSPLVLQQEGPCWNLCGVCMSFIFYFSPASSHSPNIWFMGSLMILNDLWRCECERAAVQLTGNLIRPNPHRHSAAGIGCSNPVNPRSDSMDGWMVIHVIIVT